MKTNSMILLVMLFFGVSINSYAQTPEELYSEAISKYNAGEYVKTASMLTKFLELGSVDDEIKSQIEEVIQWCKNYKGTMRILEIQGVIRNNNQGNIRPSRIVIEPERKPYLPKIY